MSAFICRGENLRHKRTVHPSYIGPEDEYIDDAVLVDDILAATSIPSMRNASQLKKALQDRGFSNFDDLLDAFSQLKAERDAAVRDLEHLMYLSEDMYSCQICSDECKNHNGLCRPKWGGIETKKAEGESDNVPNNS